MSIKLCCNYCVIVRPLNLPTWEDEKFESKGWMIDAMKEEIRKPNLVRVGLIQHSIVLSTTDSVQNQRNALHEKIGTYINHAAACNVNILCLQEAWSMQNL